MNNKISRSYEPVLVETRYKAYSRVGGCGLIVLFDVSLSDRQIIKCLTNNPSYSRFGWESMGVVTEFVSI